MRRAWPEGFEPFEKPHVETLNDLWLIGCTDRIKAMQFFRKYGVLDEHGSRTYETAFAPVATLSEAKQVVESMPFCYAKTEMDHPMRYASATCGPHHYRGTAMDLDRLEVLAKLDEAGILYEWRPVVREVWYYYPPDATACYA